MKIIDDTVSAVLVRKDSADGAVYVSGPGTMKEVPWVRTGPDKGKGVVILIIKTGQTCVILGSSVVRYFRPRIPVK